MACLGNICCGGNQSLIRFPNDQSGRVSGSNHSLSIPNRPTKILSQKISTAMLSPVNVTATVLSDRPVCFDGGLDHDSEYDRIEKKPRVSEKFDGWMKDSVADIVKNLRESPLLVQIYAGENGSTTVKTEKAVAVDWPEVMREKMTSPDGIILVEELTQEKKDLELELELETEFDSNDGITRAFGVLVQGKRGGGERECESACYLLKTSRVRGGMGLFATHFCLMKVNSFRKSAFSQLSDCWLLH